MCGGWTPSVHLFSPVARQLCIRRRIRHISCRPRARWALAPAPVRHWPSACATEPRPAAVSRGLAPSRGVPKLTPAATRRRLRVPHGKAFVDFQNDVTAKDIAVAASEGFRSIEHVKRYTTTGMATDQGKTSGLNALATVAALPARGSRSRADHVSSALYAGDVRRARRHCARRAVRAGAAHADTTGPRRRVRCSRMSGHGSAPAASRRRRGPCMPPSRANASAVRNDGGMIDAWTLGKIEVSGPMQRNSSSRIYTGRFNSLRPGRCRYAVLLGEDGFSSTTAWSPGSRPIVSMSPRRPAAPPSCCITWRTIFRRSSPACGSG